MSILKKGTSVTIILAFILAGIMATPVNAADIYVFPTETPETTSDPTKFNPPYTTVTIEVSPKQDSIPPGAPLVWTITVTYDVTSNGAGHVNKAYVRLFKYDWASNLGGGYSLPNPQVYTITGPTSLPGNQYEITVQKDSGYYSEGTVFVLTYTITTPALDGSGNPYLLTSVYHRSYGDFSGQESSSGNKINVRFNVGPGFEVPENPLGTFGVITSLFVALALIIVMKRH